MIGDVCIICGKGARAGHRDESNLGRWGCLATAVGGNNNQQRLTLLHPRVVWFRECDKHPHLCRHLHLHHLPCTPSSTSAHTLILLSSVSEHASVDQYNIATTATFAPAAYISTSTSHLDCARKEKGKERNASPIAHCHGRRGAFCCQLWPGD